MSGEIILNQDASYSLRPCTKPSSSILFNHGVSKPGIFRRSKCHSPLQHLILETTPLSENNGLRGHVTCRGALGLPLDRSYVTSLLPRFTASTPTPSFVFEGDAGREGPRIPSRLPTSPPTLPVVPPVPRTLYRSLGPRPRTRDLRLDSCKARPVDVALFT